MKRDSELIRELLLAIECRPAGDRIAGDSLGMDEQDELVLVEHLRLLEEAGYIELRTTQYVEDLHQMLANVEVLRITWQGHELLDAISSDTVWEKTKERTSKLGGNVSMNVLAEVAGSVAKGMLGLS